MFPRIHYPPGSGDTTIAPTNSDSNSNSLDEAINLTTESDWWANAIEDDSFYSQLPFDASENGLWNGKFVPPPPRPPFLDDTVASDGLTTCDLCTWAWHDRNAFSLDGTIAGKRHHFRCVFSHHLSKRMCDAFVKKTRSLLTLCIMIVFNSLCKNKMMIFKVKNVKKKKQPTGQV
jgi:hypothetical protein